MRRTGFASRARPPSMPSVTSRLRIMICTSTVRASVVDADGRAQIGVGRILAEWNPLAAVFNHEAIALDSCETGQHRATRETIDYSGTPRTRRLNPRRDD